METTMKIKLNRGPAKGKRYNVPDDTFRYLVQVNTPSYADIRIATSPYMMYEPEILVKRGEYQKSHTVLKDGTVVFEWMGWTNG